MGEQNLDNIEPLKIIDKLGSQTKLDWLELVGLAYEHGQGIMLHIVTRCSNFLECKYEVN